MPNHAATSARRSPSLIRCTARRRILPTSRGQVFVHLASCSMLILRLRKFPGMSSKLLIYQYCDSDRRGLSVACGLLFSVERCPRSRWNGIPLRPQPCPRSLGIGVPHCMEYAQKHDAHPNQVTGSRIGSAGDGARRGCVRCRHGARYAAAGPEVAGFCRSKVALVAWRESGDRVK